jgi:tRNA 2-thiouridine synthesizing protein A
MSEADQIVIVDARGLRCPLPVLRLQRAAALNPAGSRFRLLADDPAAAADVPAYAAQRGWQLEDGCTGDAGVLCWTISTI